MFFLAARKWVYLHLFIVLLGISTVLGVFVQTSVPYLPLNGHVKYESQTLMTPELITTKTEPRDLARSEGQLILVMVILVAVLLLMAHKLHKKQDNELTAQRLLGGGLVVGFCMMFFFGIGLVGPPTLVLFSFTVVCVFAVFATGLLAWNFRSSLMITND